MNKKLVFSVWIPQGMSRCISGATNVALSLYLYKITGSQLILTSILSLSALTSIYFSPLAGGIADNINKRKLLLWGNLLAAALSIFIGIGAFKGPNIPLLYTSIILSGIVGSAVTITLQSVVREISKEEHLVKVNSFISIVQNAPIIIGPTLGALLYSTIEFIHIIFINSVSFLVAGIFAYIALGELKDEKNHSKRNWFRLPFKGAKEGFAILWQDKDMRYCQLWYSMANFGNGIAAGLISPYIIMISQNANAALGSYGTLGGIGVLLAAIYLYIFKLVGKKSYWVIISILIGALLGRLPLIFTNSIFVISIISFIRSISLELSNAPLLSIWQRVTSKELQGRIFGARRLLAQAPYPIAVWLGGKFSVYLSVILRNKEKAVSYVIVIGVLIEIVSVAGLFLSKSLLKLEDRKV